MNIYDRSDNSTVSDGATNNRKASIRKLNAAQLSILVDQPGIELDELHKINSLKIQKYEDAQTAHDFMILEVKKSWEFEKLFITYSRFSYEI